MKKGSMNALALAFLGLAAIAPSPAAAKSSSQSIQKEQINQRVSSGKEVIKQVAGGFTVVGNRDGIPPHIYGMYHVRRGTHKRSNK